jgi:hypothetical protein
VKQTGFPRGALLPCAFKLVNGSISRTRRNLNSSSLNCLRTGSYR